MRRLNRRTTLTSHVRIEDQLSDRDTIETADCVICGATFADRWRFQHLVSEEVVGNLCKRCAPADYADTIQRLEAIETTTQ